MSIQAVEIFKNRLEKVVDVHRDAGDLSNAEVIGVLEMVKLDIYQECVEDDKDDDDDDDSF